MRVADVIAKTDVALTHSVSRTCRATTIDVGLLIVGARSWRRSTAVGAAVGAPAVALVGTAVVAAVGASVGASVGAAVDAGVGCAVGAKPHQHTGIAAMRTIATRMHCVGPRLGAGVAAAAGAPVGAAVSMAVDAVVGAAVGAAASVVVGAAERRSCWWRRW